MWQPVLATTARRVDPRDPVLGAVRLLGLLDPPRSVLALAEDPVTGEPATAPVLLLAHRRDADAVRTAATVLVGHQPERPVAWLLTEHAPLAGLVALDRAAAATEDPGEAAALVAELLAGTWSGAVLSSVTRLQDPNPPMTQHLRSWWPASRFLVRQGPDAASVPLDRAGTLLPDLPRRSHELWTSDGDEAPAVAEVAAATGPTSVRHVDGLGTWPGLYGRAELVQLALLPAETPQVPLQAAPCRGCGLARTAATCPFCRTDDATETTGATVVTEVPVATGAGDSADVSQEEAGDAAPEPDPAPRPVTASAGDTP